MAFGTAFRTPTESTEKRESPFLKLAENQDVVIRILDEEIVHFWAYYMYINVGGQKAGRSIIVGRDNPIKDYMNSLENSKDNSKYARPTHRWRCNVLDRTPNDRGERLNKVFILEGGKRLMDEIEPLDNRVRSRRDFSKKLSLQEFDILLVTTGSGKDGKSTKAMQQVDEEEGPLPRELLMLPRYDLAKISAPFPNEAVQDLLDGKDYNEVMKAIGRSGDWPMLSEMAPF